MKKILLTATVQSHIAQFHLPLIDMLQEKGYEVHVAARNNLAEKNGLELKTPEKIFDVPFNRSPFSLENIRAYKLLKDILLENNYDVVHCNTPMGGVVTRLAAKESRKKGMKVFYTAHGFHFYRGAPLKNWLFYYPVEKKLARYTDKLITITKEDYEIASKTFKTNVFHVHGVGANSKKFFPCQKDVVVKLRKELGYSKDQFILLCIGELNKNKNQSAVIKAIAKVKKDVPNIKLLLAGNGPLEQELRKLVFGLKLQDYIDFLGYRTDLEKFVNISDVVISASFREGLPLNIMEAMLCEKPVLASINRGHKELVQDNTTGYLVDPNNIDGFSKSILKLNKDEKLRQSMGKAGREVVKHFTTENVIDELKQVYESK